MSTQRLAYLLNLPLSTEPELRRALTDILGRVIRQVNTGAAFDVDSIAASSVVGSGVTLVDSSAAQRVCTLVPAVDWIDQVLHIKSVAGTTLVAAQAGETIDGTRTASIRTGHSLSLVSDGNNWWSIGARRGQLSEATYMTSGKFILTPDVVGLVAESIGAGGGSACAQPTGAGDISIGGGGGGGGVQRKIYARDELLGMVSASSTIACSYGTGGAGGTVGGTQAGSSGGNTTFGTGGDAITGNGGNGGAVGAAGPAAQTPGALGGSGSGPADSMTFNGEPSSATSGGFAIGLHNSKGGGNRHSQGGVASTVGNAGTAGLGHGAGASGPTCNGGNATGIAGTAGNNGAIYIELYT